MSAGECQFCGNNYKNLGAHRCKAKKEDTQKDTVVTSDIQDIKPIETVSEIKEKKQSLFSRIFHKEKSIVVEVKSPEELIEGLPLYKIPLNNPKSGLGKVFNRNKDFIQVVLVSQLLEPKTYWAEKTGINRIKIGDRMYKLPRDIRGEVFFWHVDKKEPLVDTAEATDSDAETSFHELQLANMYYSIGRAAGANDLLNNLKLILILSAITSILVFGAILYMSGIKSTVNENDAQILNTLYYINGTIGR